ncbi:unnamed protein product [Rotaria sp. Silwood2]|nr:unnamed protein product [Rotaria sp. Silwood2]
MATTAGPATLNSTFTFPVSTGSKSSITSGTPSVSQSFVFGAGVQNTPTVSTSGNPPTSTTPANFTSTSFGSTSISGTNQAVPATQSTNVLASNLTTPSKFGSLFAQAISSIASTKPTMSSTTNTTTTNYSPFGITTNPSPFGTTTNPSAFGTTTNPSGFGTTTNPSVFGTTTNPSGFGTTTNPSGFGTTTNPNVFATTTNPSGFGTTTNPSGFGTTTNPSGFGTTTNPNVFATTTNPSGFGTTTNISGIPLSTTTSITPFTSSFPNFTSNTTNNLGSHAISQVAKQDQNTEQSISMIQQRFLAASLLDPYATRGKKDFPNIDQIQVPTETTVVSTLSTTTITETVTTSTSIPSTMPIQTNFRKGSSCHSLVDVNFKLKPVSSSPTLNDTIKPSDQQSTIPTGQMKSTLKGNFTDEEELVLLGQTKMSKLRLSNAIIDPPYQSNSIHSLYPARSLADLENLINKTASRSSPTTTVYNQRISHSANENRDISPNRHSESPIISQKSSSPIIQRKSKQNSQNCHLPILTRDNYYMKPTISELKSLFNDNSECILPHFTVGHEKYGSVTFYGQINVSGLNLDEIITVYPDDNNKPLVGEELNLPARITLLGVYPIDRSTREEITDIKRIKALNYDYYLRTITKKFDGEFINYGIHDGSWTFTVKHFTRYGLGDNQNDFVVKSKIIDPNQSIIASNFIELRPNNVK